MSSKTEQARLEREHIKSGMNGHGKGVNSGISGISGHKVENENGGWDEPLPLQTFQPPPFPVDALCAWQAQFVAALAEATQTPPDLAALQVLGACAAAVAGKYIVQAKRGHIEPLNLYALAVLGSGNRKSAVVNEVVAPVESYERELARQVAAEIAEKQTEFKIRQSVLDRMEKQAATATGDAQLVAIANAKSAARDLAAFQVPAVPRILADDVTPEKIITLLYEQSGRIAIISPEGDLFDIASGRYSNGVPNIGVFLKAHAGDAIRVDRGSRPSEFVPRPALTVAIAAQPSVLNSLANKPEFRGKGFLARFLYAMPESRVGYRDEDPEPLPESIRGRYHNGLTALLKLPGAEDDFGESAAHTLHLSDEARDALTRFEAELEPRLGPHGDLGHIADWGSKLAGAVVRIAGVLHISRFGAGAISRHVGADTLARAIDIGQYLIIHACAAFAAMGADGSLEDAAFLLAWIIRWMDDKQTFVFNKRSAYHGTKTRFKHVADVDGPLSVLIDHDFIRLVPTEEPDGEQKRPRGRPASPQYVINPAVQDQKYQKYQKYKDGLLSGPDHKDQKYQKYQKSEEEGLGEVEAGSPPADASALWREQHGADAAF